MPTATTNTPRISRWLRSRLNAAMSPLKVYEQAVPQGVTGRVVVYQQQSPAVPTRTLPGEHMARSVWLVYVAERVPYWEDLQADADKLHEAVFLPVHETATVQGRDVLACYRESEHALPVYDGVTLVDRQLGGVYVLLSSTTT